MQVNLISSERVFSGNMLLGSKCLMCLYMVFCMENVSLWSSRTNRLIQKNIMLQIYDVAVLKPESQIKELGVAQYERLKFNQHVSQVTRRQGYGMASFLNTTLKFNFYSSFAKKSFFSSVSYICREINGKFKSRILYRNYDSPFLNCLKMELIQCTKGLSCCVF